MKTKQRSKAKESPKWHILFAGIGALILSLPVYFVMCVKVFFKNKKRNKRTLSNIKPGEKYDNAPLMPYNEPISPVDNGEFLFRIDEFICFQFKRFNGLSGRSYNYQLLASESTELKEYVLLFLKSIRLQICFMGM